MVDPAKEEQGSVRDSASKSANEPIQETDESVQEWHSLDEAINPGMRVALGLDEPENSPDTEKADPKTPENDSNLQEKELPSLHQQAKQELRDIGTSIEGTSKLLWESCRGAVIGRALLTVPTSVQAALVPVLTGGLVNGIANAATPQEVTAAAALWGGALAGSTLLFGVLRTLQVHYAQIMTVVSETEARKEFFKRVSLQPAATIREEQFNRNLQKIRDNVSRVNDFTHGSFDIISNTVKFSAAAVALGMVDPWLTAGITLTALPLLHAEYKKAGLNHQTELKVAAISTKFWPRFFGQTDKETITELKVLGKTGWAREKLDEIGDKIRDHRLGFIAETTKLGFLYNSINAGVTAAALGVVAWRASQGLLDAGQVVQFLGAAGVLHMAVSDFSAVFGRMSKSAQYLKDSLLLGAPAKEQEAEELDNETKALIQKLSAEPPSITFKGVTFDIGKKRILEVKDVHIKGGEFVGIVGEKGAGKTTFINLLLGIEKPTTGYIELDCRGEKLKLSGKVIKAWQQVVGFKRQEFFHGNTYTIREVVELGRTVPGQGYSAEEIVEKTGASSIMKQGENIDQVVIGAWSDEEHGSDLSGGERQLLSNTRALLADHPVIVMDEPFSNLDAGASTVMSDALREIRAAKENQTLIVIAHNYGALDEAEKIIVLTEGIVEAVGSRAELLKNREGLFSRHLLIQIRKLTPGYKCDVRDGELVIEKD